MRVATDNQHPNSHHAVVCHLNLGMRKGLVKSNSPQTAQHLSNILSLSLFLTDLVGYVPQEKNFLRSHTHTHSKIVIRTLTTRSIRVVVLNIGVTNRSKRTNNGRTHNERTTVGQTWYMETVC